MKMKKMKTWILLIRKIKTAMEQLKSSRESIASYSKMQSKKRIREKNNCRLLYFCFSQKIKVDNVFDIQWDEKTKLADLDWQSSANFLDTISKVWGIKVEKTHKDTYRILGNLIRSEI